MLNTIPDKQRRAVRVVKTSLAAAGLHKHTVCVSVNSWQGQYGRREEYAVFVSSLDGEEPFYVQGSTLVAAVRNMLDSIKGRANNAATDVSETAPF